MGFLGTCPGVRTLINAVLRQKDYDICLQSENGTLRPRPSAFKAKVMLHRGQGHATSRPRLRPPKFVIKVSSRTRTVLEDPIPVDDTRSDLT